MKQPLPRVTHDEDPEDHEKETYILDDETVIGSVPATAQRPCFIVVSGKRSLGRIFKLNDGMVVGRALGAQILLEEEGVSRRHARVGVGPDGIVQIVDMGSSNGIVYGHVRVAQRALREGDRIQLGDAVLMLVYMDDVDETMLRNLSESATVDVATQLPNRKYFNDVLAKELTYSLRYGRPLTIFLFSVDQYKAIQDAHGKAASDRALARLARTISEIVRADGVVIARYGEEEIALLVPEMTSDSSRQCAEWIRRAAESLAFKIDNHRIPLTISGGVARSDARNVTTPQDLVDRAHQGLYRAKMGGKNCVDLS